MVGCIACESSVATVRFGDDSAGVAFARQHAVVRRKVINDGNSVGLIVSVV